MDSLTETHYDSVFSDNDGSRRIDAVSEQRTTAACGTSTPMQLASIQHNALPINVRQYCKSISLSAHWGSLGITNGATSCLPLEIFMRKFREVLRLTHQQQYSTREIAAAVRLSHTNRGRDPGFPGPHTDPDERVNTSGSSLRSRSRT